MLLGFQVFCLTNPKSSFKSNDFEIEREIEREIVRVRVMVFIVLQREKREEREIVKTCWAPNEKPEPSPYK